MRSASPVRMTPRIVKPFIRTSWSDSPCFASSRFTRAWRLILFFAVARSVRRQIEENDNDDAQGYPIIPTGRADHPQTAHCPPQSLGRRYDRTSRTRGGTFRAGASQRPGAKRHRHLQIPDRRRSRGDRAKTRAAATIRAASIDAHPSIRYWSPPAGHKTQLTQRMHA